MVRLYDIEGLISVGGLEGATPPSVKTGDDDREPSLQVVRIATFGICL